MYIDIDGISDAHIFVFSPIRNEKKNTQKNYHSNTCICVVCKETMQTTWSVKNELRQKVALQTALQSREHVHECIAQRYFTAVKTRLLVLT